MSEAQQAWDPRVDELTHDIVEGQVYGDSRHAPEDDDEEWPDHAVYRLTYVDEDVVLMRSNSFGERTRNRRYRQETRDTFEECAGSGRYKLLEEADNAPPMPDDLQEVRALANRWRDHFAKQGGRVGNHKAEGMEEFIEELRKLEPKEVDVKAVGGVGDDTAEALEEAGLTTDQAILAAREDLLDVEGVGQTVADRLIETAEEAE